MVGGNSRNKKSNKILKGEVARPAGHFRAEEHLLEPYGVEVSTGLISEVIAMVGKQEAITQVRCLPA